MAQIHNELRRGALSNSVKNFLGSADPESGVERFGETLTPILDPFTRPELNLPRGDGRFERLAIVPAVAARFSAICLFNPASSKLLVVIEVIMADVLAFYGVETGDSSGAFQNLQLLQGWPCDTRSKPPGETSVALLKAGTAAAATVAPMMRKVDNAIPGGRTEYVLAPNSSLILIDQTVNQAMAASVQWRERKAPEEV